MAKMSKKKAKEAGTDRRDNLMKYRNTLHSVVENKFIFSTANVLSQIQEKSYRYIAKLMNVEIFPDTEVKVRNSQTKRAEDYNKKARD